MSHYNNFLGFMPSTNDENIERLKESLELLLGIKWESKDEFIATNLYQLFQGFSQMKMGLENSVTTITRDYFAFLNFNKEKIGFSKSGTYEGIAQAFKAVCGGVAFSSAMNTAQQQLDAYKVTTPGVCLIALDYLTDSENQYILDTTGNKQEPDTTAVTQVFFENFPLATITYNGTPPVIDASDLDNLNRQVDVSFENGEKNSYYYTLPNIVPLGIQIQYRAFDNAIIPSGEDQILKDTFTAVFFATQKLGVDFEPSRFLSSQNVPWLAEVEITCTQSPSTDPLDFNEGRLQASFVDKFTLYKYDNGGYLITTAPLSAV